MDFPSIFENDDIAQHHVKSEPITAMMESESDADADTDNAVDADDAGDESEENDDDYIETEGTCESQLLTTRSTLRYPRRNR